MDLIILEKTEKQWIKLCKGYYQHDYPFIGSWVKNLKPLFIKIYGWDPDEDNNYNSYLNCIFEKLFEIYLKIYKDLPTYELNLKKIFEASFYKSISRNEESPIERSISMLCALIQGNKIFDENGIKRYEL